MDGIRLLDQIPDAVVLADGAGTIVAANPAAGRLLRCDAGSLVGRLVVDLVPPRFRPAHLVGFANVVASGHGPHINAQPLRVAALGCDGTETEVELSLGLLPGAPESEITVVATLRPVTDNSALQRQALLSRYLQATVEAAREGVVAISPDRRVLAVNRRFCRLWSLPEDSIAVGDPSPAMLAPSLDQVLDIAAFQSGIAWGHDHPTESQTLDVPLRDGRVISGYAAPVLDPEGGYLGRVWYLWDDTERRTEEAERETLLLQLRAVQRSQRFLLDASAVLAHANGVSETLGALARVAVPALGDICMIDVLGEGGVLRRVAAVHADPAQQPLLDELLQLYTPESGGSHPGVEAMRRRESVWAAEVPEELVRTIAQQPRHLEIVRQLDFTGYMSVPLIADDQVLGTATLISTGSTRRFDRQDVALAEELADRVALVVAKERRYEGERRISHTLQASLLPTRPPVVSGARVAVRYLAGTRDADVGGDFWDCLQMPNGELALAVGDVAGHDITAAATMAQLRSACRALRPHSSGPADLVRLLQQTWDQLGLDRISTAVFGWLNPASGALRLASAGHPAPVVIDGHGAWVPSLDPAPPLGAPPAPAGTWTGTLPASASLLFYTDGLVEDRRRDIDEGTRRLVAAAAAAPRDDPERLADHVLATLSGADRADDVALLVVTRGPAPGGH